MKSTENQADVNLLEVHQMAVDNAIRQQENRQAIARLRIDHERDVQDLRKDAAESKLNIDTFLSKAEKHLDRAAELQEEIRQILSETAQKQRESGVDMEEIKKKLSETAQILSETAQMQRKSGVDIEEIKKLQRETAQNRRESGVDMAEIKKKLSETAQILSETAQMQRKSGVDIEEIKKLQRETAQNRRESGVDIEEIKKMLSETAQNRRESGVDIEEIKKLQRETTQQMKETDRKIKELSTRFSSTTGHIIEGLMSSSAIKMYEDKGFKINSLCKNYKRKNKQLNLEMEQDVVLFTDTQVIVEEVKASCDKKDVDKFFRNMEMFKLLYDEYADKEVLGAVAAVNYEDGADTYARNLGLFVVRVSSDEIFTLDPFKLEELKRF
ncbi:MAG: hypothetical protein IKN78_03420 [Bacteroidales bacterium]|nr:hypothetical protein [Bacteroidales bacterium]